MVVDEAGARIRGVELEVVVYDTQELGRDCGASKIVHFWGLKSCS